jgi:hypothetical protein
MVDSYLELEESLDQSAEDPGLTEAVNQALQQTQEAAGHATEQAGQGAQDTVGGAAQQAASGQQEEAR